MNTKELRIGNYVNVTRSHGKGEKKTTIEEVNLHYLKQIENNAEYIQPIEITRNLLRELNFKKRKAQHKFHWENRIVIAEYDDDTFYPYTGPTYFEHAGEIKYIHQLQNLHYALTGKELIFTP